MIALARAIGRVGAAAILASVIAWGAAELAPGGVATAAARATGFWPPEDAGEERREAARASARDRFGLDGAAATRLLGRAASLLVLELGTSWRDGRAVGPRVGAALARTAGIATLALLVGGALGTALGLRAGARPGGAGDRALGGTSALGLAVPPVWVVALALGTLAVTGRVIDGPWLGPLVATAAVALPLALLLARHARAGRIELAGGPLLTAIAARGLDPRATRRHARAVLASGLLGVLAALAPWAIGAVLAIEHLLAVPGLGALIVPAAASGDVPMVAGVAAAAGALGAATAAALGALARAADPRRAEVPR